MAKRVGNHPGRHPTLNALRVQPLRGLWLRDRPYTVGFGHTA